MSYRHEVGRALSRLGNALLFGEGDTTISASVGRRVYEQGRGGWWKRAQRLIDWVNAEPLHCRDAYLWHQAHGLFKRD